MEALRWSGAFAVVMVMAYGVIFAVDPRIDSAASAVARHMLTLRTEFWEYLLWAMSPIPLIFAICGMHTLLASRPGMLSVVLLWSVPTMLFYFKATTTPRYFLNCAMPLSLAAAVGIDETAGRLRTWFGGRLAWLTVAGLAGAHLVVALGHVSHVSQLLRGAFITTDDRAMPTGALLYTTYFNRNVLARSLPDPQFGTRSGPYWEPLAFTRAIQTLADRSAPKRTVIILLAGGWAHAFHYHAQVAGARYVSRAPSDPSLPFASETWLELGNTLVMTIRWKSAHYGPLALFDVKQGDQIWVLGEDPFPDDAALQKMPPGLSVETAETFDTHFRVFDVTAARTGQRR